MSRRAKMVAAVLWALSALAAGPARAQSAAFGATPLTVPAPTAPVQISLAPWTAPPAFDLFLSQPRADGSGFLAVYRRGDLAQLSLPWPSTQFGGTCLAAGSWVGPGLPSTPGDGLADLAWCARLELRYQFSSSPPPLSYGAATLRENTATGLAFARLLDRADLVLAVGEGLGVELAPAPQDPSFASGQLYYTDPLITVGASTLALQPLRLGTVARGPQGLQDLAWSRAGRPDLFVLETLLASAQAAPANWSGKLLSFQNAQEVRGAGQADFDGDGIPDLLAVVVPPAGSPRLMEVRNLGTLASLDAASAVDVGAALGLAAPRFAAPLDLDGVPAAAVFDGGAAPRLHVVTANPGGGLRSWSTATDPAWGEPTQVLAGDLVGSRAADLVAVFVNGATAATTVRIWPGDLPPAIAWASGSPPAQAGTAAPLSVAVDATDADGSVASVDLRLQGLPSGVAPVQSGSRYTFTVPASTLCGFRPATALALSVRATDDLGAWREVAATVPFSDAPALALPGAGSTRAVPLLPGGTSVALAAQASDACGRAVTVVWADSGLPAGATATTAGASVHTIAVPEAAYPGMVAGPSMTMSVTATATAAAGTAVSAPASAQVTLAFDASGLVAAEHRSDRAALAPGELALLTTTLRSAIGVSLPQVALDDRLSGLVPAGPARVSGAQLLAEADGPGGVSVTLDAIPGGGAPVVVELPVRLAEGAGGSSRAQALAAATGVALSPAVQAAAGGTPAGIACGSGGASPLALLGLLLYMKAMRRVPARTRSTSSRTPMSRQA